MCPVVYSKLFYPVQELQLNLEERFFNYLTNIGRNTSIRDCQSGQLSSRVILLSTTKHGLSKRSADTAKFNGHDQNAVVHLLRDLRVKQRNNPFGVQLIVLSTHGFYGFATSVWLQTLIQSLVTNVMQVSGASPYWCVRVEGSTSSRRVIRVPPFRVLRVHPIRVQQIQDVVEVWSCRGCAASDKRAYAR